MKLIIEIDVDSSDMEEADVQNLIKEANRSNASMNVEVGSAIEDEDGVFRMCSISTDYFKIRTER